MFADFLPHPLIRPLAKVKLTPLNPPDAGGRNLAPSPFRGGLGRGFSYLCKESIELGANWLHFRKQAALAAALAFPMIDPTLIDPLRCSLLHHEMPGWKAAIASFSQSGGYANLRDRIAQVQHPTLILWGEAYAFSI